MKKLRAFRLGKRLVRVWRWVRPHRRVKHTPYVPLTNVTTTTTTPPSPSRSPHLYRNHHRKTATAVTAKLADWGRSITRRFGPSSRACPRHAAPPGGEEDDHLLPPQLEKDEKGLHRRRRRPKQQQGEAGEEVEGEGAWWKPPPKGYLAVYVGRKGVEPPRRLLVPVVYFNHPLFGELLRGAEEEFGFHHPGGISIPCPIADFESVRRRVAAAAGALGSRRCRTADGWRYRLWVMRR